MIGRVYLGARVGSDEDFELLVEVLRAIGLGDGVVRENEDARTATFSPTKLIFDLIRRKKPWRDVDLSVTVSDPDTVYRLIEGRELKIVEDYSGPEPSHAARTFVVKLPGGTRLRIIGTRADEGVLDTDHIALEGQLDASGKRFGIVVSRFNSFITERLVAGTLDGLVRCGAKLYEDIEIVRVPGAFEIPSAARTLALTGKYDAIICIGCLLRGDTAHYDVIVNEVTRGIGQSAQETGVPHAFGVLTCDTLEQAIDRAGLKMGNKGFEAALAAVEMASLKEAVSPQPSAVRKAAARRQPSVASKAAVSSRRSAIVKSVRRSSAGRKSRKRK
ncbi:MAG TPA: 6,7-dimethyl-8-ribityllumazine synthase [Candidatus Sulfotelmatobacter sp.]|nr:6,7-dimethyl-8-ribityllumazine synthase [Candidatus Sulfotelmatobacter sp.]